MANKCFHGVIKDWKTILNNDGDYLVRQDAHFGNQYILTVRAGGTYYSLLLLDKNGKVSVGGKLFRSIDHFLNTHSNNGAKLKWGQLLLELRSPVALEL